MGNAGSGSGYGVGGGAQAFPLPSLGSVGHFEDPFSKNEPDPWDQPEKNR